MTYVVELTGYDPVGAASVTRRYAMGAGLALTDATYVPGNLSSWQSATQQIEIGQDGVVGLTGDVGQLIVSNVPADQYSAGPLDALCGYAWAGRQTHLYWVPALVWADKVLLDFGILEQPVASMDGSITFPIRDPRADLSSPLQTATYLGDNSGGAGVEGESDLKGALKPVLYGIVSNIPGVRVNASLLIYQLSDKPAAVICARDGGLGYTAGTSRANLASLQSNTPPPATYDYYSGSEGLFVRLGSTPTDVVSFDAKEGSSDANRTHAQVWSRIRTERSILVAGGGLASSVDSGSVTALDAIVTDQIGFWWSDTATLQDAISTVLGSLSGFEVLGYDNLWRIYQLTPPSSETTVVNLKLMTPAAIFGTKDRALSAISYVRPSFAPNGSPACKVNVNWGQNYTLMSAADFHGAAPQRLRDKFALAWRTSIAKNTTIWDQANNTGLFPNAPELTVYTGYQPGTDGLTSPAADAEATRLIGIYGLMRDQYAVSFRPEPGDQILPGACVSLQHPQMGLSAGQPYRILQSVYTVANGVARVDMVLGLRGT